MILILVASYNFACSKSEIKPVAADEISGSISHLGLKRTYHFYIPSSPNPALKTPLVIALHGGGGTGQNIQKYR